MRLSQLNKNETGRIKQFHNLPPVIQKRLVSLGVHTGCDLCIKQKTMFNGPCTIECKGRLIGIRECEARQIEVEVV